MDAQKHGDVPHAIQQLHDGHLVGKEVSVAYRWVRALSQPSLQTQVEDEDMEREEEDDGGDGEAHDVKSSSCRVHAGVQDRVHVKRGRERKGGIWGGWGADWHDFGKEQKQREEMPEGKSEKQIY